MSDMGRAWVDALKLIFTTKFLLKTSGPFIASIFVVAVGHALDLAFGGESVFIEIADLIAFYLLIVVFSIAWIHIAYSPQQPVTVRYRPSKQTFLYIKTFLYLVIAAVVLMAASTVMSALASRLLHIPEIPSSWIIAGAGIVLLYVFSRLVILLPLIAFGKNLRFDQAWRMSAPVRWPLFLTSLISWFSPMIALPVFYAVVENHAPNSWGVYFDEIAYWTVNYIVQAFSVAALVIICKTAIGAALNEDAP